MNDQIPKGLPAYLGPYEVWNFEAGKGYAFPGIRAHQRYLTALAEIGPGDFAEAGPALTNGHVWAPTLWDPNRLPAVPPGTPAAGKPWRLTFYPLVIDKQARDTKDLTELCTFLGDCVQSIAIQQPGRIPAPRFQPRIRFAFPVPDAAMNAQLKGYPDDPDWTADDTLRARTKGKRIVVMAVIDDGIPFAHRNFRDAAGTRTRVEFCWLQSADRDRSQRSVLFGREYTRDRIDALIQSHGDDEDTLYRVAGATADSETPGRSAIACHTTHGAHVMDLATGYAPERGEDAPEEIRVIAVQLPNTIARDTSGFGKDMYMLSAFHYIFERADRIAEQYGEASLRLVINFSYGFSGGRHDGQSELEASIDELIRLRRAKGMPTALVVPVGNMFLDRLHGKLVERHFKDDVARFHWRLQPNDRTPSYLEIWFRQPFNAKGYTVRLLDPSGQQRAALDMPGDPGGVPIGTGDPLRTGRIDNAAGKQIGQISADHHRNGAVVEGKDRGRWRALIIMAPCEPEDAALPGAEAGRWTVELRRSPEATPLGAEDTIHCWIQRDADPAPFRSGSRQSYFEDVDDVRYGDDGALTDADTEDAFVQRFGSLNGLATARTSLMVGGFRCGAGHGSPVEAARPAGYSSAGTLASGWPLSKVACSSLSDRSKVFGGTVAAGVRSGARSLLQGTSVAAPTVARRLAEAFVTEEDERVRRSTRRNYRALLKEPSAILAELRAGGSAASRRAEAKKKRAEGRFGKLRLMPLRQPGLER